MHKNYLNAFFLFLKESAWLSKFLIFLSSLHNLYRSVERQLDAYGNVYLDCYFGNIFNSNYFLSFLLLVSIAKSYISSFLNYLLALRMPFLFWSVISSSFIWSWTRPSIIYFCYESKCDLIWTKFYLFCIWLHAYTVNLIYWVKFLLSYFNISWTNANTLSYNMISFYC